MNKFNSNTIFILVLRFEEWFLSFRFADFEWAFFWLYMYIRKKHRPWNGHTVHRCKMQNKWIYQLINLYWLDLALDFPSKSQCFRMNIQFYSNQWQLNIFSTTNQTQSNRTEPIPIATVNSSRRIKLCLNLSEIAMRLQMKEKKSSWKRFVKLHQIQNTALGYFIEH